MEKFKELLWLVFSVVVFGFVLGNCLLIPIFYMMGYTMTLALSFKCSAAAGLAYLGYGFLKRALK